ncbi:MAG: serine hydrolase domain-containing protein, partial [Bacteroidota bacterium]
YFSLNPLTMRLALFLGMTITIFNCNGLKNIDAKKANGPIDLIVKNHANALLADSKINAASIGVYKNGKIATGHFGELDKGKGNIPTDHSIYEIASVSKAFAGTLVAQAVLDKKLNLEDDIRQFLKGDYSNLDYEGNPIQVRHLITHTAGLPRFFPTRINALFNNIDENLPFRIFEIEKAYSKQAFLEDLKSITIEVIPGTSYIYSNADVELMAHILENVYQTSYEQLLQKFICDKAGMQKTRIHLSAEEQVDLVNGYGETNNPVPHFANTLWGGGSGIKSTTSDLIRFIQFQLESKNPSVQESHKILFENNDMQTAYLWPVFNDPEDGTIYRIHGGAFGTQNFLLIVPKYNLGISIITNQSGPETQGKLSNTLDNLLLDLKQL